MGNRIWIWNSMAKRRRSASDVFEENGLHILESYLISKGIEVRIFDWATVSGYNRLSPRFLLKLNVTLFKLYGRYSLISFFKSILRLMSGAVQNRLSNVQERRLHRYLTALARDVAREELPLFGIKVWYGEAFTMAKYLTDEIHKYSPKTVVVAGGYHPTIYEEDILKYTNFDLAVSGNGEEALNSLLLFANKGDGEPAGKGELLKTIIDSQKENPIPGLIYRHNGGVILNTRDNESVLDCMVPTYPDDNEKIKVHILLESYGCPWNSCSFCVHNKFAPAYKSRQISGLISELKLMIGQGIGLFRFAGSDTPPPYGRTIGEAILDARLKIEYTMGCRAVKNCKQERIYQETVTSFVVMLESGLKGIFMGGETGNNLINQQVMNKGITSEDIEYTIKAVREAEKKTGKRATVSLAMIYPTPLSGNVTLKEIRKDNLELIKLTQPDAVMVSPPGPFKGTDWFDQAEKFGFVLKPDYIPRMMEYEYVLYKPLGMWPELPFTLKGLDFKQMLTESQSFKNEIENSLEIPTDLSDEHFLMIQCLGPLSRERILNFKKMTLLSIVTSDYSYINEITQNINNYSNQLAGSNQGCLQ